MDDCPGDVDCSGCWRTTQVMEAPECAATSPIMFITQGQGLPPGMALWIPGDSLLSLDLAGRECVS